MKRRLIIVAGAVVLVICIALQVYVQGNESASFDTDTKEHKESFWVSPVLFNINDYYAGATYDKTLLRFSVHCSELPRNEYRKWLVQTFDNETEVEFPLKAPLADHDTDSMVIVSSDINESIRLISYSPSDGKIIVCGFLPNSKRYVEISYPAWTRYVIECVSPYVENLERGISLPPEGFQDWVMISDTDFILKPGETKDITSWLETPEDAVIEPDKWEYKLRVGDCPPSTDGGVTVTTSISVRCIVDMK